MRIAIASEVGNLTGAQEAVRQLHAKGILFYVSSVHSWDVAYPRIAGSAVKSCISYVCGSEMGPRRNHMKLIKEGLPSEQRPIDRLFFVGRSPRDMGLGDMAIAIVPKGKAKEFYDVGAVRTVRKLSGILDLKLEEI